MIPRNVRLGEAPSHGLPVILYDARSRGAEAYVALAHEFLARDRAIGRIDSSKRASEAEEIHHGRKTTGTGPRTERADS